MDTKGNIRIPDLLHLHFIVVLLGFTGILGKLITLPAMELVWYRMTIAALGLWLWLYFTRRLKPISIRKVAIYLLAGVVVALHWITFFGSIKSSTVSIALACFAATTLFTGFIEPLFFRYRISRIEVGLGLIIIAALGIIFRFEPDYLTGILLGLLSAFLSAVFMVLNKQFRKHESPLIITFYEMIGGAVTISLFLAVYAGSNPVQLTLHGLDVVWIAVLALVCTCYAFVASIFVMRSLSAYNVVLTISLEPVYGIVLAWLFFGDAELMTTQFYIGTVLIIASVFSYSLFKKRIQHINRQNLDG
jgi:drug/metabolite transporter (DMT)-like permease